MPGLFINHIHVFPKRVRSDGTPDAWEELAAELEIEGGVFFAPLAHQWPTGDPNGWLARELRRHRRYVGFGTLDPQKPAREQVTRIADLGLLGIKIHGPAQHFPLNCDWAMEAYGQMERLGLIADLHLGVHGYRLKDYHPLLLDEVAHRFPDLSMILEHVGGWHFYREAVAVIVNHQQRGADETGESVAEETPFWGTFFAGIASVLDPVRHPAWYLGPSGLREVLWQVGNQHLIWGADFPYNRGAHLSADLAALRGLALPPENEAALLGGNLRRLLSLKDKRGGA